MLSYVLRRIATFVPTLLVIIVLSFTLIRLAPGGPFDTEAALDPAILENLNAVYDLDGPLHAQFLRYFGDLLRGDLGPSLIYRDFSVSELLLSGFPVSFSLGVKSLLLAVLVGSCFGIFAAQNHNRAADYGVMTFAMSGIAVPNFVTAPLLTLIFAISLNWLPVAGWGGARHQILPVITLALPQIAIISRLMRSSMIEVLRSDYVLAAELRGVPKSRVITRHALRPALMPLISYLGPAVAGIVTGSVVIEQIFDLPGIGRHFVQGAINRDYTLVMGIVVFYAAAILVLNLIVDILYGVLDPKVKLT